MDTTWDFVRSCFAPRPADSHKGTYGHLYTVCGQWGMAGAAILCNRAALRSGVGLVTAAVPEEIYPIVAGQVPEAVFLPLGADGSEQLAEAVAQKADAVVAGCGLGDTEQTAALIRLLQRKRRCPMILDADGINAAGLHMLIEETASAPLILTPHPGEMARLTGLPVQTVQENREEIAADFARRYGVILVLKGHRTVIAAPDGRVTVNPTGNPGMATGGSGDVLAGIIGSLAAQGMDAFDAAVCGVYLHGAAGDAAARRLSEHAMLPGDLVEELGGLFLNLEQ